MKGYGELDGTKNLSTQATTPRGVMMKFGLLLYNLDGVNKMGGFLYYMRLMSFSLSSRRKKEQKCQYS